MTGNVQVASFIITPTGEQTSSFSVGGANSDTATYNFSVSNVNAGGKVCEVSASYKIQVELNRTLAEKYDAGLFTVKIAGADPISKSKDNIGNETLTFNGASFVAGNADTHNHSIVINVPNRANLSSATVVGNFVVKVYVEQVIGS